MSTRQGFNPALLITYGVRSIQSRTICGYHSWVYCICVRSSIDCRQKQADRNGFHCSCACCNTNNCRLIFGGCRTLGNGS